jgi:hypothetical protein
MTSLQISHTLETRLQALTLLQRDMLPGLPYDEGDAAEQALARGLDVMLAEFLGAQKGPSPRWHDKAREA